MNEITITDPIVGFRVEENEDGDVDIYIELHRDDDVVHIRYTDEGAFNLLYNAVPDANAMYEIAQEDSIEAAYLAFGVVLSDEGEDMSIEDFLPDETD